MQAIEGIGLPGSSPDSNDLETPRSGPSSNGSASSSRKAISKEPASLARACAGVQSVISTASSTLTRQAGDSIETVDRRGQLALVDAARAAGVEHFVFVSFRDNPAIRYPLTEAKREVEEALKTSGMAYTILQASYFMEVWLTPALGFDAANGKVRILRRRAASRSAGSL